MKKLITYIWVLAVAGTAIWSSGCDLGSHRQESARLRLERKMAQARLTAAHELLAAGYVDQAQRILDPFLPALDEQITMKEVQVAQQPQETSESQQFVKADSQPQDEQSEVW